MHVEQHDVGIEFADQRHGLGDGAGLADDLDGVAELGAHAGAEEVMVVHEHDALTGHVCLLNRSSTSVPLVRRRRQLGRAACPCHPATDRLGDPVRARGQRIRVEAGAAVAHVYRDLVVADVDERRDLVRARVLGRVGHRLARGEDERLDPLVERDVARADEVDGHAVQLLDLGGGRVHRGREAGALGSRAGVEPGP